MIDLKYVQDVLVAYKNIQRLEYTLHEERACCGIFIHDLTHHDFGTIVLAVNARLSRTRHYFRK